MAFSWEEGWGVNSTNMGGPSAEGRMIGDAVEEYRLDNVRDISYAGLYLLLKQQQL